MQELQRQAAAPPSAACLAVSSALASLGVQHACQALTPDSCLLADILLPQHSIVLLVEGPAGYVRDTGKRRGDICARLCRCCCRASLVKPAGPAGESASRDRLFRACGWEPVSISETQWQQLGNLGAQHAFLRSQLPAGVLGGA